MFRRYLTKFFIGLSYGISFPLTMVILDYWLKDMGLSNLAIGLFSFLHWPFMLKFFWGIFIENYDIPFLSRYFNRTKSWIVFSHILVILGILIMSLNPGSNQLIYILCGASLVAIADGCRNIVLYPYQIQGGQQKSLGFVASFVGLGHRFGSIFIKVSVLYIAHFFNWSMAYVFAASMVFVFMIIALFIKELTVNSSVISNSFKQAFYDSFYSPLCVFLKTKRGLQLICLVCLYKLADFGIQKMSRSFCMEIGFSKCDIANIVQLYGSITVIVGSFLGAYLLKKIGLIRSMFAIGLCHCLSFFSYLILLHFDSSLKILSAIITVEALSGGAMTVVFLAFFYNIAKNATIYAVLWALHEFFGLMFMGISGAIVDFAGWNVFFMCVPLSIIPSLVILKNMNSNDIPGYSEV